MRIILDKQAQGKVAVSGTTLPEEAIVEKAKVLVRETCLYLLIFLN